MTPTPPTLDAKAITTAGGGWLVSEVTEPGSIPSIPTYKVKGATLQAEAYSRAGGTVTLVESISVHAHLEVYDGASLFWRWSAVDGDLVGGP